MQESVSSPTAPTTPTDPTAPVAPTTSASPAAAPASPASSVSRSLKAARNFVADLLAERHPGTRPPADVRQTCVLMFAAAPAYGLLAYLAGDRMLSGLPEDFASGLRVLMVLAALVGLVLMALALPVRRGGTVLWRAAQVTAVVGMVVAPAGLYTAARLADTPLLLAGVLAAAVAIIVNIALWSTEVRRWCGVVSPRTSEREPREPLVRRLREKWGR